MAGMVLDPTPREWYEINAQLCAEGLGYQLIGVQAGKDHYLLYNVPAALDIETSSWIENGEKRACLTCWQFGLNGRAYIGRTWDELRDLLQELKEFLDLSEEKRIPIYVHNLGYEFQWMRHQLKKFGIWDIFAGGPREPYRAGIGGFDFRDSYCLTSLSLEKTAENEIHDYTIAKTKGWDYGLIRHSQTPLTASELEYAITDVLVVMALIEEYRGREKGYRIADIPMTRTGYVRRECRAACKKDPNYRQLMNSLKLTDQEYKDLKSAYQGGFTHANHNYVGMTMENVGSFDFTSSYPAVMVMEEFPAGIAGHTLPKDAAQLKNWLSRYCCLMHVTYYGLKAKLDQDHIISRSKCIRADNAQLDNGRVVSSDRVEIWITELDYKLINQFYSLDRFEIHEMYRYYKRHLPKPIIDTLLHYYNLKTVYKDVAGHEVEYAIAKAMCNSIYGMMVQDVVRDEIIYTDTDWERSPGISAEQIDKYNKSRNRFTYYPWGVWITAYARYNLLCGIISAGPAYIYSDTDSVKFRLDIGQNFLSYTDKYNDMVEKKMLAAMAHYGYDPDYWRPRDSVKKEQHPLGFWDREPDYKRFKTLGAKRYLGFYEKYKGKNNVLVSTVAGANKKKMAEYLKTFPDPFDAFTADLIVPPDYSGRLISTYIDTPTAGAVTDYLGNTAQYEELSSICLTPSEYTLNMSSEFISYLTNGGRPVTMVIG